MRPCQRIIVLLFAHLWNCYFVSGVRFNSSELKKEGTGQKIRDISNSIDSKNSFVFPSDDIGQESQGFKFAHQREHGPQSSHFGPKRKDHRFRFGADSGEDKGQEVEEINFGSKPENTEGQELVDFPFGGKHKEGKGQEVEDIKFGSEPENPKEQELVDFPFGAKHKEGKEQEVEDIKFGSEPENPKGQELVDFPFGTKHKEGKGQEVEDIKFGSEPENPKGQELVDFPFGAKHKEGKGQEVEDIKFGPEPENPKGQELVDFPFGTKHKEEKGQEVEDIKFGPEPENPKGQELVDFPFGAKHKEEKGQELEDIKFGNPKGQELVDFPFGAKHKEGKGQEVEDIKFGPEPENPKGQELVDFPFGTKHKEEKGQEVEDIKFRSGPDKAKGQELVDFPFGSKPKKTKNHEVEEINFGHKPEQLKGQESEDFHFGSKPVDKKGQQEEEINFGHGLKGQETEKFPFGSKPKDDKGQKLEEIEFGSEQEHPKGQEHVDFPFGLKPEDVKGQEVEEINFGHQPKEPIKQGPEDFHLGLKPGHLEGQKAEEFPFNSKPENENGQQVEEIHFGHKTNYPEEQELEDVKFDPKPGDPKDHYSTDEKEGNWIELFFPTPSIECKDTPETPINSVMKCESHRKCEATCYPGYRYSNNKEKLKFECKDAKWIIHEHDGVRLECEAVCEPPCQNDGACIAPNQCKCSKNFQGPQCQFGDKPCLNHPPVPQNSQVHCNASNCIVECFPSYYFPDGSSVAHLICQQGEWLVEKVDWNILPDCKPSCHPPCINGGTCLDYNKCQCPRQYAGPQCQYEIAACDGEKLNFNGYYTCRGENDKVTCALNCPEGVSSDVPIASEYTCEYSTGRFTPSPVPKCLYGKDIEVIKFASSSHTIGKGFEDFESNKVGPHSPPSTLGECITWKNSHYKTFDGKVFSFDGECSYTLVTDNYANSFRIVIQSAKCKKCFRTLKIFYQAKEYQLTFKDENPNLVVDDLVKPIPIQLYGFSVELKSKQILVFLHTVDVILAWDNEDRLSIQIDSIMWNKTGGLCGNFNNNPNDDFITPEGSRAWSLESFVQSWVNDVYNCQSNPEVDNSCKNNTAIDYCRDVFIDPHFEKCYNAGLYRPFIEACAWDICKCGKSCACSTIHEFVENCKQFLASQGFPDSTSDWREIAECRLDCPPGKIYSLCGPSIEEACGSFGSSGAVLKYSECVEGCFCPNGMVLLNETCIKRERCPCQWRNKNYASGQRIPKECNTCTCQDGEWICTNLKCESRCSVTGGSHYLTFDGKSYDFLSQCSYYLMKTQNYAVELENVPCLRDSGDIFEIFNSHNSEYLPCAKTIAINHGTNKIKLKAHKEIDINGKIVPSLPLNVSGVIIRGASSIYLRVTLPDNTDVWWDGNTNVYIDVPGNHKGITGGLCGTFNNNQKDDFITPEGDVEQSAIAFAEKWKTDESCREVLDLHKPHPCDSNINNKIVAEKYCQKLKQEVFKECHSQVDVEPFYKNCLHDVCSCQKDLRSCFCQIFADYGNECNRYNVEIPWRNDLRECGLHCPPGQTYQPCGDSCTRTCQDISLNGEQCIKKCVEGCNCPEGLTLNSLGECVPISKCHCTHQNSIYKPGQEMIIQSDNGTQYCTCENAIWSCRPATKLEIDRDYENSNVKCNKALHEEYTTCEPAEPKTCKNMHEKQKHSTRICFPGCVCKEGYVWDSIGKACVNASECPCHHGGRSYGDGEKIQEDCNTCTCENGLWTCTERECPAICSTWGDSHFKTFDGRIYDFQGSCEFVLASGSNSEYDTFVVNLQIVPCGSTGISCPKSVSLKVGSRHKEEEIVFKKSNPISVPKDLKRILVREAGIFIFAEVFDLGITVQWDKGTRVYIKADPKWKNRVKGLCGNFNNNELDDFKTPTSGETSEISPVVFADSWRLHTYCPESLPIPDTCARRPHRKAWAVEKCSIIKSVTFEPCHSEVPFESYLERCVIDTCGCDEGGDCECLCSAIAAYAEECTLRGVPIKWRAQSLCGLQCEEKNSQYSSCVSPCPPKSCDNQFRHSALLQTCTEESCIEGCEKPRCPPGEVFADSSLSRCVPITSCETVCLTVNNVTYLEGDLMESDNCHSCFCSHHTKICSGKPCAESTTTFITETVPTTLREHSTTPEPLTTVPVCPFGQIWDDCIVSCAHVCNYLLAELRKHSQCISGDGCVSGCRSDKLNCPYGMYLRDDTTCVHKKDCPCVSSTNSVVKPGDVIEESECEKCQCINNEYECTYVCSSTPTTTHATANYTNRRHRVTQGMEFGHDGNVTLIYHTTPTTPLITCPTGMYQSLIDTFTKFSASSSKDGAALPHNIQVDGWEPDIKDDDKYLQVDLGRVEPVFAVNVEGSSGKYVNSYILHYSVNGNKFTEIKNQDGLVEVFRGPSEGHHTVKQLLPVPIEARFIRFEPRLWEDGILMKVDVLGCEVFPTSTLSWTTPVSPICRVPIGIGQKYFPKMQIIVTSSKPTTGPNYIGFDNERGWQPLTNSKTEWVQIDFGENINFTGVVTKGVSQSNHLLSLVTESWVEAYEVEYSHDTMSWNPVLDEFGNKMVFMGNEDSETEKKNYFKRPIHARAIKIRPVKWHQNIALRLDLLGCYKPLHYEVEATPPVEIPEVNCNVCKGASNSEGPCKCIGEEWWDGEKCTSHSECPCFVGLIPYPVGTTFTTEKCEECICRLYGIPHCTPKICEDCPLGLQKVLTPLCGCACKPCKEHTKLCETSNICLEESAWCDGIEDCPDDETNCTIPAPEVKPTPKPCKPSCPPGYNIVYKKIAGPSEAEHMTQYNKVKSIKSKKSVKTYRSSKKSKKHGKMEKMTECPPYDCAPIEEVPTTECPPPECPFDYEVVYKQSEKSLGEACPLYTCDPIPDFANCSVSSRNIKTFDGTEYKYEICDHVLARDDSGAWNVTMLKTCPLASPCESGLLIYHGNHVIELNPHNRTLKFDSYLYPYSQLELLNSKIADFTINPIGNSIIFMSEVYVFGVVYEANGNVRITVPSQLKKHINGLCGLYNGHPEDDKTLPNGKLSKTTVEFGDSWFNPGGKECVETVCPFDTQKKALEICEILRRVPFTSCSQKVNLEICIESTCQCLSSNRTQDECRCQTLSDFASKCKSPDLFGWRVENDCPVSCPPNLIHYDCYPYACEPTCGNEECTEPATDCYSGCFCPDGMAKKGDTCIKIQDCRDCVCSGMGDSTYLTFDGGLTFNGNCTYVATREKNPSGLPSFEVLITNGLCNGSEFMTCTDKVEVKTSDHFVKLVALPDTEQRVMVFVDGFERSHKDLINLKEDWSRIVLNADTSSVLVELPKVHVDVQFYYLRRAFTISLPSHYYSDKVEGLCGSCTQYETLEEENPEMWQTEKDGDCLIEPPTQCIPTPEHEKICFLMIDYKIFGHCLNFIDPQPFIDQCLAMVCHNGHVCTSLEAYSQACRDIGICIDWRSSDFCPFTCPSDLEYQPCKSGCFKTCENYEEMDGSCSNPPIEGCFCPDDQALINGTCKPFKYCDYCDKEGGHYEEDFWQVDKCTNCTCRNKLVTCSRVECPVVDVTCREHEVVIVEETDECCPKHKCACKPRDECPKVELPNEVPELGMEAVVNETGCCPRVEFICRKETCPELKPCRSHYIEKFVNATDCCPQHVCEKPEHLCVYDSTTDEHKRGKRETPREIVKEIGERWTDGPCKSCVCVEKDGVAEAICMVTECTDLERHHDFNEYDLDQIHNPDKCCPEVLRKNCKHNGTIYKVGESWMPDEKNPCETMKCNQFGPHQILKETRMEVCNEDCETGWEYKKVDGECCGHCVQVGCLAEGMIYKDGEVWFSKDRCAKSTCTKKNGHFEISTMVESCPSIKDCPEEDIYQDKCCLKCKVRAESKRNCITQSLQPEKSIKLVRVKKGKHGWCHNLHPIQNFTQCVGNCDSHTEYKPETWTHQSICKCCQPEEFSLLTVELKCEDGFEIMKSITVPSKCSCMACGG